MSKLSAMIDKFIPDAQAVLRRFPLAILMVAAMTVIMLLKANDFDTLTDEMMMRLIGGTVLAAYAAAALTLVGEGRGKPVSLLVKAGAVIAALVIAYSFRSLAFITPMAIGASILFIGSSPFWRRGRNDVGVWDFTHKIWIAVVFTVAGSIIYMIGIFSISAALKSLFNLSIRDLVEDWLMPIGLGFLAPMAWMSMVPRPGEDDDSDSLRNPGFISRAVGFLGTWILAPLTLVYALILLAYMVKIVMSRSLPNGEIAQLVTPFLVIGTLTWLILDPPFIQKKRLARWFSKIWFPLMIPAAILLAVAVSIRIGEYGWTIDRYLLVLASVWALGTALWFTFRGESKRDIRIIPGFAAALLAIGSIGPWGADGFSAISQNARLEKALAANDMLGADGYLKPAADLSIKDKEASVIAKGALKYLIKHKKRGKISRFVNSAENFDFIDTVNSDRLNNSAIYERFKLNGVHLPSRYNKANEGDVRYGNENVSVAVLGYDHISIQQHLGLDVKRSASYNKIKLGDFVVTNDKNNIVVMRGRDDVAQIDIMKWLEAQNFADDNTGKKVPLLILYSKGEQEIALHLMSANYSIDAGDGNFANVGFMLLTKGIEVD